MQIDPERFLDDGFLILKNVVPPERLDGLRASFETLVDRQQAIWARDRDHPSSFAYMAKQPRLAFQTVIDAATANTVEFCLHENTLGVSRQALATRDVGLKQMILLCNPEADYGPDLWHRDVSHGPTNNAPLAGLQADMLANGPSSVQWNIPLYDDDVLWIVPRQSSASEHGAGESGALERPPRTAFELYAGQAQGRRRRHVHQHHLALAQQLQHQAAAHHPSQVHLVRWPAVSVRLPLPLGAKFRQASIGGGTSGLPAVYRTG